MNLSLWAVSLRNGRPTEYMGFNFKYNPRCWFVVVYVVVTCWTQKPEIPPNVNYRLLGSGREISYGDLTISSPTIISEEPFIRLKHTIAKGVTSNAFPKNSRRFLKLVGELVVSSPYRNRVERFQRGEGTADFISLCCLNSYTEHWMPCLFSDMFFCFVCLLITTCCY